MNRNFFKVIALLLSTFVFATCSKVDELKRDENLAIMTGPIDSNYIPLKTALSFASSRIKQTKEGRLTMSTDKAVKSKLIEDYKEVAGSDGKNTYYIITYQGGGFVILSADKRTSSVLAFSDESFFPLDSVPLGLNMWLSETRDDIDLIRKSNTPYSGQDKYSILNGTHNLVVGENIPSATKVMSEPPIGTDPCANDYYTEIAPMLSTTWNQIGGYNNLMPTMTCVPTYNNGRAFTGCVATAMAQVIRYFEHPSSYNYAIMPNAVSSIFDVSAGANEISQLMLDAAESVNSNYYCDATGAAADLEDIVDGLKNTFGYTSATKKDFNVQTTKNEIYASRPVIMSGYASENGWIFIATPKAIAGLPTDIERVKFAIPLHYTFTKIGGGATPTMVGLVLTMSTQAKATINTTEKWSRT